jgi:hypothetical protein
MSDKLISRTVFLAGIMVAIIVASSISIFASSQLIAGSPGATGPKGDTGAIGSQGPTGKDGGAIRYVIEGSFDVEQNGDLIKYDETFMGIAIVHHWKKIEIPQLTLSDMPLVRVYLRTTFESVEEVSQPMQFWRDPVTLYYGYSSITENGGILYDEGCIYVYYKQVSQYPNDVDPPYTSYVTNGEYQIDFMKDSAFGLLAG